MSVTSDTFFGQVRERVKNPRPTRGAMLEIQSRVSPSASVCRLQKWKEKVMNF